MTVYEIRMANVQRLIDERFDGVASRFARAVGRVPNQVCRWFIENASSHRDIGEKLARDIERRLGIEDSWLDALHDEEVPPITESPVGKQSINITPERLVELRLECLRLANRPDLSVDQVVEAAKKYMAMVLEVK